jgi:hypothetical protein
MGQARAVTVVRLVAQGTIEEKIGVLKERKRELAAAVMDGAGTAALEGLRDDEVEALLGVLAVDEARAVDVVDEPVERAEPRFVAPRELDELRAILRRLESSGTTRKELARKVGLPQARIALVLIGHRVPIPTRTAARIRGLVR